MGGAIGRGLQDLGKGINSYSQTVEEIDDRLARTSADDLLLQYQTGARSIKTGYSAKQGKDALTARPEVDTQLNGLYSEIVAKADKRTQHYLNGRLQQYHGVFLDGIAEHAVRQSAVYEETVGGARLQNFGEQAAENWSNPELSAGFIADGRAQLRENLGRKGLSDPDIVQAEELKYVSGIHSTIIDRMLTSGDVEGADAYFRKNLGELTGKDEISIAAALKSPLEKRETFGDVASIMGGGWSDDTGTSTNYADPLRGAGKGVSDGYGVARGNGKTHNGVDFPAAAGTPIYSIGAGKVARAGYDARSGNFVVIDHGDGTTSSYSHMKAPTSLKVGDAVTPDTLLGGVGTTGHSSGNHLHLVVKKEGKTVDQQQVIGSAQQSPRRHDLDTLLTRADQRADAEGWSFERRERAKDEIRRRVSTDETLKAREEADADRAASEVVMNLGDRFRDVSQIPAHIRERLSPDAVRQYMGVAKSNQKSEAVEANGGTATSLELMRILEPERFAREPLGKYAGQVTRAELQGLAVEQAKILKGDPDKSIRSKVASTISTFGVEDGLTGSKEPERQKRVAVQKIMESEIQAVTGGKRNPTDDELYRAYQSATRDVTFKVNTTVLGIPTGQADRTKPRFELGIGDVPENIRQRISRGYQNQFGRAPTDDEIATAYRNGKGRYW
ncbi:peptidoglycan DD-metalloendopeptidase family protein [Sphingobium chungbukense]|nr:peptidoglycan DD-metalloendopeptidase family protein [Sphingobium chungbukense]